MTDYCSRKEDHTISGVTMKIRKGKKPPRGMGEGGKVKRSAEQMEEGGVEGGEGLNPLMSD